MSLYLTKDPLREGMTEGEENPLVTPPEEVEINTYFKETYHGVAVRKDFFARIQIPLTILNIILPILLVLDYSVAVHEGTWAEIAALAILHIIQLIVLIYQIMTWINHPLFRFVGTKGEIPQKWLL